MLEGDEYEDQLLGDPSNLDDIIEARDLDPLENEEENPAGDAQEQEDDQGDKKVKPKRRVTNPMPKLDVLRLTGPRGVAIVEKLFSDFKFYGPGYEARDLKRIMQRFELWGNRLFPKYQFDDLLEKVEKLGNKKQVANFVDKIRMGIVNEDSVAEDRTADNDIIDMVDDEDSTTITQRESNQNEDAFDQLLSEQLTQINSQRPTQHNVFQVDIQNKITDDQRQRMIKNRLLAEQRRLARLKADQEKTKESNNEINSPINNEINSPIDNKINSTVDNKINSTVNKINSTVDNEIISTVNNEINSPAIKISSKCEDVNSLISDVPVVCVADNDHPEVIHEDDMTENIENR